MPVPRQLPHIQTLRAVAALLVVMHHAQGEAAALAVRSSRAFAPSGLLPWAAGVDVFFVISGFIIVHASGRGAPGGRLRFLAHRVARVVPLYWLATVLYLAVAVALPGSLSEAGAGLAPGTVAAAFLFWPAARPDGTVQPLYGLGWTLNCEMAFYALFAIGLGFGRRLAAVWIVAALLALVTAGAWIAPISVPLAFWSNPVMLEFGLGALIALTRGEGVSVARPVRIALALAGLALLAAAGMDGAAFDGLQRPLRIGIPAALLVSAAALAPPSAAETRGSTPLTGLVVLGDASYALYLVHPFVLRAVREGLTRLGLAPFVTPWSALWPMLGLSVAAALIVHRTVERPLTRALRARLDPAIAKTV